jgi:hypothetical protein
MDCKASLRHRFRAFWIAKPPPKRHAKKKKRAASPPACSFLIVDYVNLRIRAIGRQSTNNMTQGYFLPIPKTFSEASAVRPLVERRAQCSWFENFEYIRETPTTIWESTKDF